jgi:MoaD family protein
MKIKVKLYGRYSIVVGKKEFELELKGNTIWDVVNSFVKKYPTIAKDKKFMMVLRNNIFTTFEEKIEDGDTITISPPVVSGG